MLSALPECGSLAPERFPDTREQWDDYAQEASQPQPLSAYRTLRLIPDRQLVYPPAPLNLASMSCLTGWRTLPVPCSSLWIRATGTAVPGLPFPPIRSKKSLLAHQPATLAPSVPPNVAG